MADLARFSRVKDRIRDGTYLINLIVGETIQSVGSWNDWYAEESIRPSHAF